MYSDKFPSHLLSFLEMLHKRAVTFFFSLSLSLPLCLFFPVSLKKIKDFKG
jgi:hypothetical protein